MNIIEKIDKYLMENFIGKMKKDLMKIKTTDDSDERDDMASSLMDFVDKQRNNKNKGEKESKIYNKNIKISKDINNMIGKLVDAKSDPDEMIKKILYKAKELA